MPKGKKNSSKSRSQTRASARNRATTITGTNSFKALDPDPDPPYQDEIDRSLSPSPARSRPPSSPISLQAQTSPRSLNNNDPPVPSTDVPPHASSLIPSPSTLPSSTDRNIDHSIVQQVNQMNDTMNKFSSTRPSTGNSDSTNTIAPSILEITMTEILTLLRNQEKRANSVVPQHNNVPAPPQTHMAPTPVSDPTQSYHPHRHQQRPFSQKPNVEETIAPPFDMPAPYSDQVTPISSLPKPYGSAPHVNPPMPIKTDPTPPSLQPPCADIAPSITTGPTQSAPTTVPPTDAPFDPSESTICLPPTKFNQNAFSVLIDDTKIKYSNIETYLKNKILADDSTLELSKLYSSFIRAVCFGINAPLHFLPSFRSLDRTLEFAPIFLRNLHGFTLNKCRSVFDHIGELIKAQLTNEVCISKSRSPRAALIIESNPLTDGWSLLEQLLLKRLVLCGALPDYDLDDLRSSLCFQQNETYTAFYVRVQHLLNEYKLRYRDDRFIPTIKLTNKFVVELCRSPSYFPYLMTYQEQLIKHIKTFGDVDNSYPLTFTMNEVYDMLNRMGAPATPGPLRHTQPPIIPTTITPMTTTTPSPKEDFHAVIASLDITVDNECSTPTICAAVSSNNRQRCQACLLGFHETVDCFLRGSAFQPPDLRRRINIYNQVHGDKPPPDHKFREYKPRSMNPIHKKSEHSHKHQNDDKKRSILRPRKPFANFSNKSSGKPNISQFELPADQDSYINEDTNTEDDTESPDTLSPELCAFISAQSALASDRNKYDEDDTPDPTICSFIEPNIASASYPQQQQIRTTTQPTSDPFDLTPIALSNTVLSFTPTLLQSAIHKCHEITQMRPNKRFLTQHSAAISKLPLSTFSPYCSLNLHVDSGANVNCFRDSRLFYFYIPSETKIQDVGGNSLSSKGWGGCLLNINNQVRLVAPFYHFPDNPRNTLSPSSLKQFCNYKQTILSTNDHIDLINNDNTTARLPFTTYNDLDFVNVSVMTMNGPQFTPTIAAAAKARLPLRRSPRLHPTPLLDAPTLPASAPPAPSLPHSSSTEEHPFPPTISPQADLPQLPRHAMAIIASYYIQLFPVASPREDAIRKMNSLMMNQFRNTTSTPTSKAIQSSIAQAYPRKDATLLPVIANFSRSTVTSATPLQSWIQLHVGLMHASKSSIDPIIKRNLLKDIPNNIRHLKSFDCTCYVCSLWKSNKLPKGALVDKTLLALFQKIRIDFEFYTVKSIRGFTSALGIICSSTSYPFGFPGKSKTPPLDTFRWFISTIRSMGYNTNIVHVDEDGALARSSAFCALVAQLDLVLTTTGGGNSINNGMIERSNRTKGNMVCAQLSSMSQLMKDKLPEHLTIEMFWCYAYTHANFILRRSYNRMRDEIPYYLVHKIRPSVRELVPLGSIMTIIDPHKSSKPKLSQTRAITGHFLGFSNNIKIRLYWDEKEPTQAKRSRHCIIDDVATLSALQSMFASPLLPDSRPSTTPIATSVLTNIVQSPTLNVTPDPFPPSSILSVTFDLLLHPQPLGIALKDDILFNLPFIHRLNATSILSTELPSTHHKNCYILAINGEGPINAKMAVDIFKEIQLSTSRSVTLDLVLRAEKDTSTTLSITRAMFDQLPSLLHHRPIIASLHDISERHDHFITAPSKPEVPKSYFAARKTPYKHNWKAAAWNQFEKNKNMAVFSLPFPAKDLPPDSRIFRSQLIPEIKPTDVPAVFELKIRDVIVGTPQVKNLDYMDSYAPTVDTTTVRIQMCFTCHHNYHFAVIDVKNAFQNTIAPATSRIYVTVPPDYLSWLAKTEAFEYNIDEKYYRQMLNSNQGTRDAGCLWYNLLYPILLNYGFIRCTVDHAYFVKEFEDKTYLFLSLATDDLLTSFKTYAIFDDLVAYLEQFFILTKQTGNVIKFLGVRYIQSNLCITMDQAEYTYEILYHYWGALVDIVKTATTPMRYDTDWEREMFHAQPLDAVAYRNACIKYKGPFRFWTGKFTFLSTQTRSDIIFATQRLSEYNNAPTLPAFEGVVRVLRYLAGDILRPISFPCTTFDGINKIISIASTNEKPIELEVTNLPNLFTDAELARDLATRHSYFCTCITVFNVLIQIKVKKTSTIMQHTTDSEMKGSFAGVRQLLPVRQLFAFNGYPLAEPSPLFVDNAAVAAIIDSKRMTPRCRHIDIPIALLQQEKDKAFKIKLIRTMIMLADMGTKANTPKYHRMFKLWATGAQFLPPPDHPHYKLLEMQYYEQNYGTVLKMIQNT